MTTMNYLGAYGAGTTYAVGDVVTAAGAMYYSIQAANTGHTPASSSTWWTALSVQPIVLSAAQVKSQYQTSVQDLGKSMDREITAKMLIATMKLLVDLGVITTAQKADIDNVFQTLRGQLASKQSG